MKRMLITFIGTRGTHPSSGQGTMSFIIDNKIVFDLCPEFIISYKRFSQAWSKQEEKDPEQKIKMLYGNPSFSHLEHIFLSHFHYDHWGGLRHLLIYLQMFNSERTSKPLNIYIAKESMDIFKIRMSQLFNISLTGISTKEFFLRYLLIEIDTSIIDIIKIHELEADSTIKIGQYVVESRSTTHMPGSLAFKITSTKYKLMQDKLVKFNLPKGPLLSKIQRNGEIVHNNVKIKVSDIFKIERTIVGYSSDTKVDLELLEFFKDSDVLIHESTYLTSADEYHTDLHSSLNELMEKIAEYPIRLFAPVHFSGRYKWEEIEEAVNHLNSMMVKMKIFSPKFADFIYYNEKSKEFLIKSLDTSKPAW